MVECKLCFEVGAARQAVREVGVSKLLKDTIGPLEIILMALPALLVAFGIAAHVVSLHTSVVSGSDANLRQELLQEEPDIFWTDKIHLNSNWDETAFPLIAKYKRNTILVVLVGPITPFLFGLFLPGKVRIKFKFDKSRTVKTLTRNYFAGGVLLLCLGALLMLLTPSGYRLASCSSRSFNECIGLQLIFVSLTIWGSIYFFAACVELSYRKGRSSP